MTTPDFQIDHNVYILGAGFSRDADLPVLDDFLKQMRDTRVALGANRALDVYDPSYIDKVLEFRRYAAAASDRVKLNLDNLEELLCLATMPISGGMGSNELLARALPLAIGMTLNKQQNDYYEISTRQKRKFLSIFTDNKDNPRHGWKDIPGWTNDTFTFIQGRERYSVPIYDAYVGTMLGLELANNRTRRNTIITFNYDTLIEHSLTRMNIPFSYGLDPTDIIEYGGSDIPTGLPLKWNHDVTNDVPLYLKLHGSINWAEFEQHHDVGPLKPLFYKDFDSLIRDNRCPLIEPPTWRKGNASLLRVIWNRAVQELRTATRIVLIGYSCPQTDPYFRYILAAGLISNISLTNIVVVNSDENVLSRVKKIFPSHTTSVSSAPSTQIFFSREHDLLSEINR